MRQFLPFIAFIIAAATMLAILLNGFGLDDGFRMSFAIAVILGIAGFSIIGLFEHSIIRYAYYSTIIQFGYFLLDVATGLLIGKSVWFAIIQFINFLVAGGLFAVVIALLYNGLKKEHVPDYAGLYDSNQALVLALVISCLALGGMPGFNIFVGEFIIYSSLFAIHPTLTLGAVFAGLVCFIFYFRICYVMFAGRDTIEIKLNLFTKALIALLAMLIVVLGLVPAILMTILELFT